MSGLCSFSNITLVSIDSPYEHVIAVKPNEKKIIGSIGSCIDEMLGRIEDRKCNIISAEILGVKLDNGTYTGALGHLQSDKGQIYLKGEPHFIDEDWLERSLPLRTENLWATQVLDDENKFDYFDLLKNFKFSLEFYFSYFFAFLAFGLICFYLIKSNLTKNRDYLRQTNRLKFIYFISYLFVSRKFKFKLILLFLGLFIWFTLLFVTNTIKTNKVVVDTSELINDKDALMKSRIVCFYQDDTAYNLASSSNNDSLLFKLFNDKTKFKSDQYQHEKSILKNDRCFLKHDLEHAKLIKGKSFIISQIETMIVFIFVETLKTAKRMFLLTKGIQEYNAVIYYLKYKSNYSLKLKEFWNFMDKFKYSAIENGRNVRLYDCMENKAQSIYSKTMKVYKELYEYVEDNSVGLSIIPNLFTLILILIDFGITIRSKNNRIRFNGYNVTRSLLTLFGIISSLILLIDYIYYNQIKLNLTDLILSTVQLLVFILLLIIYYYHTVHGVITSGLIFITLFILSLCYGIRFLDLTLYNGSMYSDYEKQNIKRIFLCCFCLFGFSFFVDDPFDAGIRRLENDDKVSENNETTEDHEKAPDSPKEYSSFISKITLFWYTKLIKLSYGREMKLNEIYKIPKSLEVNSVCEEFNLCYNKEIDRIKKTNQSLNRKKKFNTLNLIKVMWSIFRKRIMLIAALRLLGDFFQFLPILLLNLMINFISDPNEPKWHMIILIFGFILASSLKFILVNYTDMQSFTVGINIRTALSNLVFQKIFKLSPQSKRTRTTGEIINLFSVDSGKFTGTAPFFVLFLSSPLQIFFGFYLLYMFLGRASFIGIGVIAFSMLSQYILTRFNYKYFATEMKINDERVKLVNEMLSGIKIIKFNGWESCFEERITNVRNKQSKYFKRVFALEAVLGWIFFSLTPVLLFTATISVYIFFVDNDLTPSRVFSAIAVFNLLDVPIEGLSSFLGEDELENYVDRKFNNEFAIEIKNKAKFSWEISADNQDNENQAFSESTERLNDESKNEEKKVFELKNIELQIKKNSFTVIIGQVGSGKSSLLSAILGEMHLIENDSGVKGKVNVSDDQSINYVSQIPWIQNASFKDNILFNKSFDKQKYDNVINACALEPDLQQFEAGDETEIGEKGINLSGGQKQRVSIARACYLSLLENNQNQIILLDDPLSAVDAHVGKHLCKNVLNSKTGILKGTTRLLVTNQLNQLNDLNVDQIILLRDGKIELKCTLDELNNLNREGKLNSFNLKLNQNEEIDEKTDDDDDNESIKSDNNEKNRLKEKKEINKNNKKLIEKEKREVGRVKINNYLIYLKYYGIFNIIIVLLMKISGSFFQLYARVYLSNWTEDNLNKSHINKETNKQHLITFSEYSLAECSLNLLANLIMTIGMIRTIKLFHQKLLHKIIRSPMRWFDTTPLGRIINRFSSDISDIDLVLPFAVRSLILFLTKLLSSIVILIIKQPDTIVFYLLIFAIYIYIMNLYISSSRSLKRLDSVSKSPVVSIFSDTLVGISTIKAFGRVNQFENHLKSKIEINNRTFWYFQYGIRWLKFNLNMITNLILFIITFQFLVDKENTTAGNVGLLLSYCLSLTDSLGFVIRHFGSMETSAVSIERINEYTNNEEEAEWIKEDNRPAENWPSKGEIQFIDYSTRYREDTNLILKDLNFEVNSTEKIGIVGRTGAGKSTITLALFRIIEAAEGKILIDNLDISKIGLYDLRSKLSIIPQDPILFTGTIRFNLDPFNKHTDEDIYQSLEHAHLKEYVNSLEDGIEHEIAEGGENLSVGQRQLMCLARALLRKSKILVLDEATASVDFATDELVQKTIRSEFKDCTIITIAHRLNTVFDSNRILVIDNGELREYDKPKKLLNDTDSLFYRLAADANLD